jgi:endonuclease/exonuclease/phosphatase (EEP) superfamily protein YafD
VLTDRLRVPLLLAGVGVLAASVLGFADGRLWIAELATSVRTQLLAVGLLVLALAGFGRWVLGIGLGLATVGLNVIVLAPLYTSDAAQPATGARLELAHVQMQGAEVDEDALLEELEKRLPDALVVLEPPAGWEPSLPTGYRVERRGVDGRAVLLTNDAVRVVQAQTGLPESSLVFEIALGERRVAVLGVHVLAPTSPNATDERNDELRAVAAWAARHQGPEVVLGDLNTASWSSAMSELEDDGGLRDSAEGFGFQATWPAVLGPLGIAIDHVLLTPNLTVTDRETGPSFGSQHRSLWATVAFAGSS